MSGRLSERDAKVMDLIGKNRSFGQIATELGMTRGAVSGVVKRNGGTGRKGRPETGRNDLIIALANAGKTNADIARTVNTTKGVVAGVIHRSWSKLTPAAQRARQERKPAGVARAIEQHQAHLTASSAKTCQWPIGHPGQPGFRFCGAADVVPGKPYCKEHCAVAYRRPDASERREEKRIKKGITAWS